MSTPLPSFCELMASLGLDNDHPQDPRRSPDARSVSSSSSASSACSSPASSYLLTPPINPYPKDSPAIVISPCDVPSSSRDVDRVRRGSLGRTTRYSPYGSPVVYPRRGSLSMVYPSEEEQHKLEPTRSFSTAAARVASHRPPALSLDNPRRRPFMSDDLDGNTPISSFARRKSPQSSPTAANFPGRRTKSASPCRMMPVSLPTLPAMLSPRANSFGTPPPDAAPSPELQVPPLSRFRRNTESEHIPSSVRLSARPRAESALNPQHRRHASTLT